MGHLHGGVDLDYLSPSLLALFVSLVIGDLFLLVSLFHPSFSVSSCNFDVPLGGSVLRIFLLYHFGCTPSTSQF